MGRRALVWAVVAIAVAAPTAEASAPLTVAQYRTKVSAACMAFNHKLAGRARPTTSAQLATFYAAIVRYAPLQINGIDALHPPASLAAAQRQVLAADNDLIARIRQLIPLLRSGKLTPAKVQTDKTLNAAGAREEAGFKKIGATGCT